MKNSFISKTDLALAYFPYNDAVSARHKLMQFINQDDVLLQRLRDAGYRHRTKNLSPMQVSIIFDRLGNRQLQATEKHTKPIYTPPRYLILLAILVAFIILLSVTKLRA